MRCVLDRRDGPVALLTLAALILGLFAPSILNDGDTWWHVKVGSWILDHRQVPRFDLWSATEAGQPWTAHEWLSEAAMALAYRAAGWSGVVALCAAALSTAVWILGQALARRLEGTALAVVLLLGVSLITPSLLARPHMLALPLVALWTAELVRARDQGRRPSLWLAPVMTLWANLHGGWAFGLALAGPFALEAVFSAESIKRRAVILDWAVFGFACLAAAAMTPLGMDGLWLPFRLLRLKALRNIGEWHPIDFSQIEPLEVVLLALLSFALMRPVKLAPAMTALLAILLHLALSQGRHQMLLGMVGPIILCGPIAVALGMQDRVQVGSRFVSSLALVVGLSLIGLRLAIPFPRIDNSVSPITALAAVPVEIRSQPVLNQYDFGGYLIWSDLRPFIDSRAELYKDQGLNRYTRLTDGDAKTLNDILVSRNIRWTFFAPGARVNAMLETQPGWHRFYADRFAVVYIRRP
ncbi:MAG: hypothetical protein CGW95_05285 [Phenylobacterium zucineum]|nr:MAG: hypothetical protein CGW95_05285 [Phenylobacterium zucineum]